MKVNYRGYEIIANREKSISGYNNIYFAIFEGDKVAEDSFVDGDNNYVRTVIKMCKERVDNEIEEKRLESLLEEK